jgi:hypothetical protein
MNTLIDYLRERIKAVVWTCYGILALVLALSLYVDKSHAHSWAEQYIPFFWSFFGFAAAAAIIGFARWFGHSGIMTREDYYDKPSENGETGPDTTTFSEHA